LTVREPVAAKELEIETKKNEVEYKHAQKLSSQKLLEQEKSLRLTIETLETQQAPKTEHQAKAMLRAVEFARLEGPKTGRLAIDAGLASLRFGES